MPLREKPSRPHEAANRGRRGRSPALVSGVVEARRPAVSGAGGEVSSRPVARRPGPTEPWRVPGQGPAQPLVGVGPLPGSRKTASQLPEGQHVA